MEWFATGARTSPVTNEPLESLELRPNLVLKRLIGAYVASMRPAGQGTP